jgi:ribosomal protein S18 acetylase RimI-like enzyme
MSLLDPALIERLADSAWPAAEQVPLGPWKLRATFGVTRRANSVYTAGNGELSVSEMERLVEEAEDFYARRMLPAVFQISEATGARGLEALLRKRGYAVTGGAEVWTLDLRVRRFRPAAIDGVRLREGKEPERPWFECMLEEAEDRRRVHEQIVRRVPWPRWFVTAIAGESFAGCGMAASAEGHAGIFCMSTSAAHRRRGIALAVVNALCRWAAKRGDERAFLQVMVENEAATALYRKAGFARGYSYQYWMK